MDETKPFCYSPGCSAPACDRPAVYKIAAEWSDGTSRELKNYGLACDFMASRSSPPPGAVIRRPGSPMASRWARWSSTCCARDAATLS